MTRRLSGPTTFSRKATSSSTSSANPMPRVGRANGTERAPYCLSRCGRCLMTSSRALQNLEVSCRPGSEDISKMAMGSVVRSTRRREPLARNPYNFRLSKWQLLENYCEALLHSTFLGRDPSPCTVMSPKPLPIVTFLRAMI